MIFEQQPAKPKPSLNLEEKTVVLWSNRGSLKRVEKKQEIELLQKGWTRPTKDETRRHKTGDYNPIYDLGDNQKLQYLRPLSSSDNTPGKFKLVKITPQKTETILV